MSGRGATQSGNRLAAAVEQEAAEAVAEGLRPSVSGAAMSLA
ncbi:MAG TPA: hypothetical protein VJ672_05075 [Gemmatimonadaceae bacterium]|nr:hypothetical protein [Gemmatimonadaceae bacterium]